MLRNLRKRRRRAFILLSHLQGLAFASWSIVPRPSTWHTFLQRLRRSLGGNTRRDTRRPAMLSIEQVEERACPGTVWGNMGEHAMADFGMDLADNHIPDPKQIAIVDPYPALADLGQNAAGAQAGVTDFEENADLLASSGGAADFGLLFSSQEEDESNDGKEDTTELQGSTQDTLNTDIGDWSPQLRQAVFQNPFAYDPLQGYWFNDNSAATNGVGGTSEPDASAKGGGSEPEDGAHVPTSAPGSDTTSSGAIDQPAVDAAAGGGTGGGSSQTSPSQEPSASSEPEAPASETAQPISIGDLGLIQHTPLSGSTSKVTSLSDFAPQSMVASALDGNQHQGNRPDQLLAAAGITGTGQSQLPGIGRATALDATGIAGSVSPALFFSSPSGFNLAQATERLAPYQPAFSTSTSSAGVVTSSARGAYALDQGGDSGDQTTDYGSFTFNLTMSGDDKFLGNYTLTESGSGTFSIDPVNGPQGSITINYQLTADSGSSQGTATQSFDPTGSGRIDGFDIDGFNANTFGMDPTASTTYSLGVQSGDTYGGQLITNTGLTDGDSGGDQLTDSSTGSEFVNTTITGSGASWSFTVTGGTLPGATFSAQDQGQDDNGSGTVENWTGSASGPEQESYQYTGTGDANGDVNLTSLQDNVNSQLNTSDSDQTNYSSGSSGSDQSNETVTDSEQGSDNVSITVNSPDGQSGTLSDSERINVQVQDSDVGSDSWNDAYQTTDPNTGAPINGTESGSDSYNDGDSGSLGARVNANAAFDSNGNLTQFSFSGNLTERTSSTAGGDQGTDTIGVPGETDSDAYTDSSNTSDNYHVHLGSSGGATSVTMSDTDTGQYSDSETDTDSWGDGGTDASSGGTETDRQGDSDPDTTIVTKESGTIDGNGNIVPTSASFSTEGTDQFNDPSTLKEDSPDDAQGDEQDESQSTGTSGGNTYDLQVQQTGPTSMTLSDDEDYNENANYSETLGGAGPDISGTISASGPITDEIDQTGQTDQNGNMVMNPSSGEDDIDLTGSVNLNQDIKQAGNNGYTLMVQAMPEQSISMQEGLNPTALTPVNTEVKTKITDSGISLTEQDDEYNGAWDVDSFSDADHPVQTVTTIYTFASWPGDLVTYSGTDTTVATSTLNETDSGSESSDTVNAFTKQETTDNANLTWQSTNYEGTLSNTSDTWTSNAPNETGTSSANASGTSTTTTYLSQNHQETVNATQAGLFTTLPYSSNNEYQILDNQVVGEQEINGSITVASASGSGTSTSSTSGSSVVSTGILTGSYQRNVAWSYGAPGGTVQKTVNTDSGWVGSSTITDPTTGNTTDAPQYSPNYQQGYQSQVGTSNAPGDWISALSNFSAGMADTVSGGLTQKIRAGLGYDDVVDKSSGMYAAGGYAGTGVNVGLMLATPCQVSGIYRLGMRAYQGAQGLASSADAISQLQQGNYLSAAGCGASAILSFATAGTSCFAAGTPLLTPSGDKPIEQFRAGDQILTAPEDDPNAPLEVKPVEEVFVGHAVIWHLHIGAEVIRTTGEHPFYVRNRGWTSAKNLQPGDQLRSHDGKWTPVGEVFDTGVEEHVYNMRIADYHTYFVGKRQWGFSAWAHNACVGHHGTPREIIKKQPAALQKQIRGVRGRPNIVSVDEELHKAAHNGWGGLTPYNVEFQGRLDAIASPVAEDFWNIRAQMLQEYFGI